jgi:hypothetical protein
LQTSLKEMRTLKLDDFMKISGQSKDSAKAALKEIQL